MAGQDVIPPPFEAVLYPNPPLGEYGYFLVIGGTAVATVVGGVAFFMIGAWPVSGFLGLDLLALWAAMRWARNRGKLVEQISLDATGLHVVRTDPRGRSDNWRFDPCWVRVSLPEGRRRTTGLVLASHGRALKLGGFMTRGECETLARALNEALGPYRMRGEFR